jgi:hypothetical protein
VTTVGRYRPRPGPARLHGDQGQVGGIEVLPFGLLIFVIGTLVVTNAWAVVDATVAADAAARQADRTYVEAPDAATGAARAQSVADDTLAGYGRRPDLARVSVDLHGQPFARCVPATVEVEFPVPALTLPFVGGLGQAFTVHAHHTERIDPFRSGVPGTATC